MSGKSEYFYDCEELLKYLNSRTNEDIENETAIETQDISVSRPAINNWKHLAKNKLSIARIEALRINKAANIATFTDVESLCTKIKHDNSTPNAKRVFKMLVSDNEKLKLCITDDNNHTSLVKYMTGVLKVKNDVNYLPGRSVDLSMLCDFGKTLNTHYKKSGIIEGLKALVRLKLVEAFVVTETEDGQYTTEQVSKEDITADEKILYKLSIKGCIEYMNVNNENC